MVCHGQDKTSISQVPLLLTEDHSKLNIWCLSAITMWFWGLELSFMYERHVALQERGIIPSVGQRSGFVSSALDEWPRVSDVPVYRVIVCNRSAVILICISSFGEELPGDADQEEGRGTRWAGWSRKEVVPLCRVRMWKRLTGLDSGHWKTAVSIHLTGKRSRNTALKIEMIL